MGTLYVVATPIGNLGDMTPRAVEVLQSVSLIAAEDTRHSAGLLRHFGITTKTISFHKFNERSREEQLLRALEENDVALISDAGTPAIADPGNALIGAVLEAGHRVVPIPGASSVTAALSASGLVDGPFLVLGFLPRSGEERRNALGKAIAAGLPFVILESPNRVLATLQDLLDLCGDRAALLARELTKLHEEVRRAKLSDLIASFREHEPRGEIVLVIAGQEAESGEESVEDLIRSLLGKGLKPSKIAREVAQITGKPGSEVYELVRKLSAV